MNDNLSSHEENNGFHSLVDRARLAGIIPPLRYFMRESVEIIPAWRGYWFDNSEKDYKLLAMFYYKKHVIPTVFSLVSYNNTEDYLNEAMLGILEAIRKFDPSTGNLFSTMGFVYAKYRVLDAMRRNGKYPPSYWLKLNKQSEVESELFDKIIETGTIKLPRLLSFNDEGFGIENTKDCFDILRLMEDKEFVDHLLPHLSLGELLIYQAYYVDDLSANEVARLLGGVGGQDITESRFSQLYISMIGHLRALACSHLENPNSHTHRNLANGSTLDEIVATFLRETPTVSFLPENIPPRLKRALKKDVKQSIAKKRNKLRDKIMCGI